MIERLYWCWSSEQSKNDGSAVVASYPEEAAQLYAVSDEDGLASLGSGVEVCVNIHNLTDAPFDQTKHTVTLSVE